MITDEASEPIVWIQSRIAIDDRLTVTLTPGSLDFGSQPVVTPEPEEWILILMTLTALVVARSAYPIFLSRITESGVCG